MKQRRTKLVPLSEYAELNKKQQELVDELFIQFNELIAENRCLQQTTDSLRQSLELILFCPECNERHIDKGEWATRRHHTHACQYCGFVWRPAVAHTVGVGFLPGFGPPTK